MPQRSRGSKTIGAEQHSAVRNRGEWRVKLDELTERKNDNNLLKRPAFYSIILTRMTWHLHVKINSRLLSNNFHLGACSHGEEIQGLIRPMSSIQNWIARYCCLHREIQTGKLIPNMEG